MLAGLKEGQVRLFKRDGEGKVAVSRKETDITGWSADEVLRNYLDVPSPTDLETAEHVERLQVLRRKKSLTEDELQELDQLKEQVSQDLTGGPVTELAERLAGLMKQSRATSKKPDSEGTRAVRRRRRTSQ